MSDSEGGKRIVDVNEPGEATATLYATLQQLAIHGQENKNFTLYNLLLFNSFLLVAWTTVFTGQRSWPDIAAATILCMLGFATAVAWAPLARDYANACDAFRKAHAKAEDFLPTRWPRPMADREAQIALRAQTFWWRHIGKQDLLIYLPIAFVLLYIVLLLLTWLKWIYADSASPIRSSIAGVCPFDTI